MKKGRHGSGRPLKTFSDYLPDEFCTDLPNAHRTGTGDASKARVANVTAWIIELRVIEDVEEFTPDLERLGFGDRD